MPLVIKIPKTDASVKKSIAFPAVPLAKRFVDFPDEITPAPSLRKKHIPSSFNHFVPNYFDPQISQMGSDYFPMKGNHPFFQSFCPELF